VLRLSPVPGQRLRSCSRGVPSMGDWCRMSAGCMLLHFSAAGSAVALGHNVAHCCVQCGRDKERMNTRHKCCVDTHPRAYTRILEQQEILQEAGLSLHDDHNTCTTCMTRVRFTLVATTAEGVKIRSVDDTAADWLLHPPALGGQATGKGLTSKAHLCPASAKAQMSERSDHVLVVQNNYQDKPCVQMMNKINNIRSGDRVLIISKAISQEEFLELQRSRATSQEREAANVDRIEISDDKDDKADAATVLAPALPARVLAEAAAHAEDLHLPHSFAPQRNSSIQVSTLPLGLVARTNLSIFGIEHGHSGGARVLAH